MDRRLTPFNGRVAHVSLRGQVDAEEFVEGRIEQVIDAPFLHDKPQGKRDRQLLWGDQVRVLDAKRDWSFVQSLKDGYVGYMCYSLVPPQTLTHKVTQRSTWAYREPDLKTPAAGVLHFGSKVCITGGQGQWAELSVPETLVRPAQTWFVPAAHLAPIGQYSSDPVGIAEKFLGTPYVWAGNTGFGIDCSGLVQAALLACAIPCPGDSDMQEAELGKTLPPNTPAQRGDLFFWKGHVALAVDADTLIHANAFHMAVAYEPINEAIARIQAQGDGQVTRHARLT